jgi:hypothetical protein
MELPATLHPPATVNAEPAAGLRVRATTRGWQHTSVYHSIYLPPEWSPQSQWPMIVEFPGNGGYVKGRDISHGTPEACSLGYGLTEGHGVIWVSLPFISKDTGNAKNCTAWWGDLAETQRYCLATVQDICHRYHADEKHILLAGFSRGALACSYLGLRDAEISSLWCGFFAHSHFDGLRQTWPYPDKDEASAVRRLQRLAGRPLWFSHEASTQDAQLFFQKHSIAATVHTLPFPNHTDQWLLRDLPLTQTARHWASEVLGLRR